MIARKDKKSQYQLDRHGWPINPATGQPFTRDQIVTDPAIPYPLDIDPDTDYWRRRSPEELEAEQQAIAKKARARAQRQSSRRTVKATATQALRQVERTGRAMGEMVERVNEPEGRTVFVTCGGFTTVVEL